MGMGPPSHEGGVIGMKRSELSSGPDALIVEIIRRFAVILVFSRIW